jgi:hypothetical protein
MYLHPKWQNLGSIGNYTLCIIDRLNYGIYRNDTKFGYKTTQFFGRLAEALDKLLELLVKDKASAAKINDIADLREIVKEARNEVIVFGRQLEKKLKKGADEA